MKQRTRSFHRSLFHLALPVAMLAGAAMCHAEQVRQVSAAGAIPLALSTSSEADALHIVVGRSVLLNSATPLRRVYVGNPAVLQTYTSGTDQVVLTAKEPGESTLVVWDD